MLAHVALVSQTTEVSLGQLSKVAAAIQKQIARDFSPIWEVDVTVSAFALIDDVPLGYWHVIIEDELSSGQAGLHKREDNGQPFALVALTLNWTVFMSHEVLEMLVDPDGTRTVAGDSLKSGQGRVEYLVEVCDPCQAASLAYSVNGIMVSDFYTPHYFEPVKSTGVRYSYSGAIKKPRDVLDGGYLSWHDPASKHLFQLMVDGRKKTIVDQGAVAPDTALRAFSDRVAVDRRQAITRGGSRRGVLLDAQLDYRHRRRGRVQETSLNTAVAASGQSLREQISRIKSGGGAPAHRTLGGSFQ